MRERIQNGNAGEHIACAALQLAGVQSSITSHAATYDIVGDVGDRTLRVEVKARSVVVNNRETGLPSVMLPWSKNFHKVDAVCLVNMPSGRFAFIPASELITGKSVSVHLEDMVTFDQKSPFSAKSCVDAVVFGRKHTGRLLRPKIDRFASAAIGAATRRKNAAALSVATH